jgi:hypothetical protein
MSDYFGRYFSDRDRNLVSALNNELKNNIVEVYITAFTIAPNQTKTNIYGESVAATGKSFYPGIDIYCWIERADLTNRNEGFGSDKTQDLEFRFTEEDLRNASYYPQSGDVFFFNQRYYEIENIFNDKQLLGGQPDKNLSIIAKSHYTKISSLNVISRQV